MLRTFAKLAFVGLFGAVLAVPAASAAATTVPQATDDNPFADLGLPEVAVTITDDVFEGVPTELAAGRYVLVVTNALEAEDGAETSGVAFLRAPEGMTAAELVEMLSPGAQTATTGDGSVPAAEQDGGDETPPWYYETEIAGGIYAYPGETRHVVVDLTAGEWILWAEDPAAPQAPVALVVTGEPPADQPTPTADVTIEMSEFAFAFDPPLAAGPQVIQLSNVGEQPHFLGLGQVPDGTTVDEVLAVFESPEEPASSGPVPASSDVAPASSDAGGLGFEDITVVFDTGDQSAGTTAWYSVELAAGTYVAVCFITDPETGMPHAMVGMTQIVVVE